MNLTIDQVFYKTFPIKAYCLTRPVREHTRMVDGPSSLANGTDHPDGYVVPKLR